MSHHKGKGLDLHQQVYRRLTSMLSLGESKRQAMATGTTKDKIFSIATYRTYYKHCQYFVRWIKETHPQCKSLSSAEKYTIEWLNSRARNGSLSAWTLQTEAKAINKLYGIEPGDKLYWVPPERNRADIKRSRVDVVRDSHFSKTNNDELIKFCQGTGLRRSELQALKGKDFITKKQIETEISRLEGKQRSSREETLLSVLKDTRLFKNNASFVIVRSGKGGRMRVCPVIGPYSQQIIDRIKSTPGEKKVWDHIPVHADIHGYRADYASFLYKSEAREIDKIPFDRINHGTGHRYQSEVYHCRGDERGRSLDKRAMLICSKALGHNRLSIVAENYLRGL